MDPKKKIGVVGGMGPMATVRLLDRIVSRTEAACDADHIRVFIDNNPMIPDRTEAILHGGPSPVEAIRESIHILENCGADFVIIPCNTSHYFFGAIEKDCNIEIVNMIAETGRVLNERGVKKVGVLATTGAVKGKVFEKFLSPFGIEVVYPDEMGQKAVMNLIYNGVKAGKADYDTSDFLRVVKCLKDAGAEEIIAGCTEISVAREQYGLDFEITDTLDVLAEVSIVKAGYLLRGGNAT